MLSVLNELIYFTLVEEIVSLGRESVMPWNNMFYISLHLA